MYSLTILCLLLLLPLRGELRLLIQAFGAGGHEHQFHVNQGLKIILGRVNASSFRSQQGRRLRGEKG